MDKRKIKKRVDEQTAKDHTAMRHWADRRYNRYERTMHEPVLPRFCKICFICMLAATAMGVTGDVASYIRNPAEGLAVLLRNASGTAFFLWLIFALMLVPCALVQLRRGFAGEAYARFRTPRRGKMPQPPEMIFRGYCIVAGCGLIVFALAFILSQAGR